MNRPLLTIGMPVYNDKPFLNKALESLLNQTFSNFELLISDDCSSDGSSDICKLFSEKDQRVIYKRQDKNIGISKNMEFLLSLAKGEYFMWAANDDMWSDIFVETIIHELEKNKNLIAGFCPFICVNEDGQQIGELIREDYSGLNADIRLRKLIKLRSDGFGYGIFRRNNISNIKFPNWIWPNHKCAYDNIFPALVFVLSKGDYKLIGNEALWFNTIKSNENINHKIPFTNNFTLCYSAFVIRRFNLIVECVKAMMNAKLKFRVIAKNSIQFFIYWFFMPCFFSFRKKYVSFKLKKFESFI